MSYWLVSSRLLVNRELGQHAVRVSNGLIDKIASKEEALQSGEEVVDYGDLVILPGIVDSHVHANEPGRVEWEGMFTATRAAAAGGVTTIVDMPLNSVPLTVNVDALQAKVHAMENKMWVDVGLLGGIIPGNESEISHLIDAGVLGFKCFMCDSGIPEFPPVNEKQITVAMHEIAKKEHPVVFMFHAESDEVLMNVRQTPPPASFRFYSSFLYTRPQNAEDEAIQKVVALCNATGVKSHIVHLSSASALDIIKTAHEANVRITAETTYHYLYFCSEDIPDGNTLFKCCPPIRSKTNRDSLWEAVKEGTITQLCSDHSPCTIDLKGVDEGDFDKAWGGIASLQLGLPCVWTRAREYGVSIPQLSQVMSEQTAQLVSLGDVKGTIEVGKHADFVVWDPEARFIVEPDVLQMKNKISPYNGQELYGVVKATYLRGSLIYNGEAPGGFVNDKPQGVWTKPSHLM